MFVESEHPRHPEGTHEGGKFAPKDATVASDLYDREVEREGEVTEAEFLANLTAEQRARLEEAQRLQALSVPTDAPVSAGGFMQEDGHYTPERVEAHNNILGAMFTDEKVRAATPAPGEAPLATFLGGRGGSGKSWLFSKDGPVDIERAIYINSDDVKSLLPGYKGWNAGLLHEESADVALQAERLARTHRLNVVFDATMRSPVTPRVNQYLAEGYNVDGYYVFASPKTAATRAVERFGSTGRMVQPGYILGSKTNERSFDAVKSKFRNWGLYSSNHGFPTKLVAQGGQ